MGFHLKTCVRLLSASIWFELVLSECFGPFVPTVSQFSPKNLDKELTQVVSIVAEKQVTLHAVRIGRMTRYCPDMFFKPKSSCQRRHTFLRLSKKEVLDTIERKACLVGRHCNPLECSGAMSSNCVSDLRTRIMPRGHESLPEEDDKAFYYTCMQQWSCDFFNSMTSPHANPSGTDFFIRTLNSMQVPYKPGVHHIDGWNLLLSSANIVTRNESITCYKSKLYMLCKHEDEYLLMQGGMGRDRNKILLTEGAGSDGWGNLGSVATVDELKHFTTQVLESHMFLSSNVHNLISWTQSLQTQVLDLITRLSPETLTAHLGGYTQESHHDKSFSLCRSNVTNRLELNSQPLNMAQPVEWIEEDISANPIIDNDVVVSQLDNVPYEEVDPGSDWKVGAWIDAHLVVFTRIGSFLGWASAVVILLRKQ